MEQEIEKRPEMWALPYNAACLESLAGNADEAFAMLERARELAPPEEISGYLREDSDLDNIRDDPRFQELLG
jgi:adenylate cyclase